MKHIQHMAPRLSGLALLVLAACSDGPSEAESMTRAREAAAKSEFRQAHIEIQNVLQKNAYSGEARLLLANVLYQMDQPALAVVELRKALDQGQSESAVLPLLAQSLLKQGQAKTVLSDLASKRLPDPKADADLGTSIASALQAVGRSSDADAKLSEVLAARPNHPPAVLLKAQMVADKGDVNAAVAQVDQLLQAVPDDADAWRAKGDLLLYGKGDTDGAVASYAKALEVHPKDPLASKAIIFVHLARGELPEAERRLADMKRVLPNDLQTKYFDAQIALLKGDPRKARDLLGPVLKATPDSAWALVLAGAIEMELAHWPQAEAHLARAVRLYPSLPNPRMLLARAALRSGDPARAIATLEPMLGPRMSPPVAALNLGAEAYLMSGNPQRAVELFDAAAKADPSAARAQVGRARAMAARGDADAAMAEFVRLSAVDSGNTADLALISLHLQRGRLADASAAVDALLKKRPNDLEGYRLKAELALRQGRKADARATFERALQIDANYYAGVAGLAALDQAEGKTDSARARFKKLLEARPGTLQAQLALARLDGLSTGSSETVLRQLRAAVSSHPDDARPNLELVGHLLSSGDPKAALTAATQADRVIQGHPEVMFMLATAQAAAGEQEHALATYGKLLSLRPNFMAAYVGMGELQLRMKNAPGAAASFRRARQIRPDDPRVTTGLVRAEAMAGRYDAALSVARDMSARRKDSPVGLMQEAEVELLRGRPAAAADAYSAALKRKAATTSLAAVAYDGLMRAEARERADALAADWLRGHPDDIAFLSSMGRALLQAGDLGAAEKRLQEVLVVQPDHVAALNNLAWLMTLQKRKGAVQLAERALAHEPESPQILDTLAQALVVDGNLARAATVQLQAIQKRGGNAPTDYNFSLARIYLAQGKKDEAVVELRKLAALGETYPAAAEVAHLLKAASE